MQATSSRRKRRMRRLFLSIGCLTASLALFAAANVARAAACADPLAEETALGGALRETLDREALGRFYAGLPVGCAWSAENAELLVAALADAGAHGLDLGDFHLDAAARPAAFVAPGARDLLLSDAAIRYARDMRNGRVELESVERDIDFPRPVTDPVADLKTALARNSLAQWLAALPPRQPEYKRLAAAYARYRAIAATGGWEMLAVPERSLKPGTTSALVPALMRRLAAEGDLAETAIERDRFDGDVVAALTRFQARHGLEADGILGRKTIEALNVSAGERANSIAINLERWRSLSSAIPPTRVEVNTAAATATLIVADKPALKMRAVVGKKRTPTPMLRSVISAVVVNPPWVVPESIKRNEILPTLKRQPDYFEKHNMYWRDNQIVQAPGEKNSLGRLKFELSSSFSVYLHDTPAKSLFARDDRARSHGCVRLEKPLELAERLLEDDPAWPRARIEEAIAAGATKRIATPDDIPVVLVYWTSFVGEDGTVEFRDDLYGRDARLMAALERRQKEKTVPVARIAFEPGCNA